MKKDEIIPRDYGILLDRVAAILTQARRKAIFVRRCLTNLSPVLYWLTLSPHGKETRG